MKRLLAALAGILGIAWLRNRHAAPVTDPAADLRAKLAAAREADDREEFEAGETAVDEAPDPGAPDPAAVSDRRREVHDRARSAIDDLSAD